MKRTALIDTEFTKNGEVRLSDITTLKVYNAGETVVNINGLPIYPNQKEIIIPADGTVSNVLLNVEFFKSSKHFYLKNINDIVSVIYNSFAIKSNINKTDIANILKSFDYSKDFYNQLAQSSIFEQPNKDYFYTYYDFLEIGDIPVIIELEAFNKVVFIYKHII